MGCDGSVYFPTHTRVADVADVLGILAGLPFTRTELAVRVEGVSVKPTVVPEMVEIELRGNMFDGSTYATCTWHFETTRNARHEPNAKGERHLYFTARPFW